MFGQFIYSALATYGFCLIFNVRAVIGLYASVIGGLGWLVYYILNEMLLPLGFSFFLAGATVTLGSELIARKLKTPVTSSLIPAFTPLVPGGGAYYTMLYLVNGEYDRAMEKGAETFIIAIGIIFGFLVVTDFFKLYTKYDKRRKNEKNKCS